jgi:hypothetical protein
MRFKMIGNGRFQYLARTGKYVEWPAVGVALQRNYISVYLSLRKDGAPLIQSYAGKLGALRVGHHNFSFRAYEDLNIRMAGSLFAQAVRSSAPLRVVAFKDMQKQGALQQTEDGREKDLPPLYACVPHLLPFQCSWRFCRLVGLQSLILRRSKRRSPAGAGRDGKCGLTDHGAPLITG